MRKSQLLKMLEQIAGDPEIRLEFDRISATYISKDFDVFGREITSPVANDEAEFGSCKTLNQSDNPKGFDLG